MSRDEPKWAHGRPNEPNYSGLRAPIWAPASLGSLGSEARIFKPLGSGLNEPGSFGLRAHWAPGSLHPRCVTRSARPLRPLRSAPPARPTLQTPSMKLRGNINLFGDYSQIDMFSAPFCSSGHNRAPKIFVILKDLILFKHIFNSIQQSSILQWRVSTLLGARGQTTFIIWFMY